MDTTIATSRQFHVFALLLFLIATPALAGEFRIVVLWHEPDPPTPDTFHVRAGAIARYIGPQDGNDHFATLQTEICTIYDKRGPEVCGFGNGINLGGGPWNPGHLLTCNDTKCMGQQYISRPCCGFRTADFTPKAAVTIYHQFSPDIDTLRGSAIAVACKHCSTQCNQGSSAGTAFVLPIRGQTPELQPELERLASEFRLSHTDTQGPITYLMDEWALVSSDTLTGNLGNGSSSSSMDLAAWFVAQNSTNQSLAAVTPQAEDWAALIVMAPPHPNVQRSIPLPEAGLHRTWLSGSTGSGLLAVRIDYGEDRIPLAFEVLHQEGAVSQREITFARNNLFLRYKSSKQHRTILYAVLRFDGEVEIESSVTLLPQCCGPEPPWIPPEI